MTDLLNQPQRYNLIKNDTPTYHKLANYNHVEDETSIECCVGGDMFKCGDTYKLRPESNLCKTYISERCANKWDQLCDVVSDDKNMLTNTLHKRYCTIDRQTLLPTISMSQMVYTPCTETCTPVNGRNSESPVVCEYSGECKWLCNLPDNKSDLNKDLQLQKCLDNPSLCQPFINEICSYAKENDISLDGSNLQQQCVKEGIITLSGSSNSNQSKSSNHHSKSSNHHSKSLNHHSKSPNHHSKSPNHHSKSPNHHSKSPNHHSKSANHHSKSLNHHSKSPNHHSKSPNHHSKSPNHHSKSPNHHSKSPNHHSKSPNHHSKSSNHHSKSPNHHSKSSNHHSKSGSSNNFMNDDEDKGFNTKKILSVAVIIAFLAIVMIILYLKFKKSKAFTPVPL
jgi:hypothetical protein